jgi:hypothetical protein
MNRALYALILLLVFSLPFEIIHPILILPRFEFTNLELLVLAAISVWLISAWQRLPIKLWTESASAGAAVNPTMPGLLKSGRYLLVWFPLLFLAMTVLSAALAPDHRLDALKFTTRVVTGLAVFWMLIDVVRARSHLAALLWAATLGTGVSALLGLGEFVAWPPFVSSLLPLFKEASTRVGGELRVSASFQYATMAAIFFEMAVPLAVALAATPSLMRRGVALAVALLGTANVVFTFSRAGMVTLALILVIMLASALRQLRLRPLALPAFFALGTLAAMTSLLAWQAETFRTRLVTENDLDWYGASYTVPGSLRLTAGESTTMTVTVQNTGTVQWHATGRNPFALGYYWLTDDGQAVQDGHIEVPLPYSVSPGDRVGVMVSLRPSLPPGDYQLVWGMLQHNILWFRHRNIPEAHTVVHIDEGTAFVPAPLETIASIPGGEMPTLPPTVERFELWRAAVRMWAERPLLGVGPDNFRHRYGRYLDLPDWDRRLHANNLYLELLAGWGLAGTLAFAGLMLVVAHRWLRLWRRATGMVAIWTVALGGSFLAFFIHGLLDYFLEFVPLYLLFWIVAALIVAMERIARKSTH